MNIRLLQPHEYDRWIAMRRRLWPDSPQAEQYFTKGTIDGFREIVLVAEEGGELLGFSEISLRPYARGCVSSPVGYLEAWYVEPHARRRGVAAAMLAAAEQWAIEHGCSEFASDLHWENDISRAAHFAERFESADRSHFFRKRLLSPAKPSSDFIGIVPFELDAGSITDVVADPAAGGIDVFLGTTRAEKHGDGHELLALDYETYADMATKQLNDLAKQAREKWPIIKLAILHRVGRVGLGEPSVVIAVSTPHRADAFEACRWIIDALKKDVAIWKKEIWSDGSGSWVNV